jgi:branched-chain amino acid transport system substrate-binding protein
VAASFHESGYDAHYAFRHGFEAAGGNIVENRITHMHAHSGDLLHVIAAVRQARPDFVYASYSGRPAIDFVKAYASSGLNEKVPLIGSGFLAEDTYLPALGDAALGIKTCMPWAPSLDTDQNRAFVAAYRQQSGRSPDIFAVLGYDSARLLVEILQRAGWEPNRSERLQQTFRSVECDSPRGRLRMHAQTSSTSGPLYLREVVRRDGVLRNEVIAELDRTNEREQFIEPMRLSLNTGWLNPYLCT